MITILLRADRPRKLCNNSLFSSTLNNTFFNVGPPKEDIFFDHFLWSIFHSVLHITDYKLPVGPLRAAFMYCFNSCHLDLWVLFRLLSPCYVLDFSFLFRATTQHTMPCSVNSVHIVE